MNERLSKLDKALKRLEEGTLDKKSLAEAVKLARQIYEQWIILQHEFPEDEEDLILESFNEIKTPVKNTLKEKELLREEVVEAIVEEKISVNQTTLIDIIEEIQEDMTINERISQGNTKESLAQKHAKKAIADIEKSIGLNQRFSFIKNLFNNDKESYNEAVKKLNSCASFLEADDYIHNVLKPTYNWDENTVHVIKFIDIIERRYLPH
jgi:hypothetical protein